MTLDTDLEPRRDEAGRGRRSLKETALEARTLLRERAGDIGEQSRHYAEIAGRGLSTAQRRAVETVREKPVSTAAVAILGTAFIVGLVFALRSPETVKRLADRVRREF